MENEIDDTIADLLSDDITKQKAVEIILQLHNDNLIEVRKDRLDILNWAKSELANETNSKLGKTMHPYRIDKISFLVRVIKKLVIKK